MKDDIESMARTMQGSLGDKVYEAYKLACLVHEGQKRQSGEPYVSHPVIVAKMLFDMGADTDTICAALLHDVLEENDRFPGLESRIHREFGDLVLYMVRSLSKDEAIENKKEQQSQYLEQIRRAFEVDISVFFIKTADILHNMSTIVSLSPERKTQWVKELQYQYLPLFSEYYHRIPMPYHGLYYKLVGEIQKLIDSDEQAKNSHPRAK